MDPLIEWLLTPVVLSTMTRMGAVAVFVVLVALISERLGPFFGAMLASLPSYTGPVYLFLALDHPPEHLERVAIGSIVICGVTPVYFLVYGLMARAGHAMTPSLLVALSAWLACAIGIQLNSWSLVEAILFATPIYAVGVPLGRYFTGGVALKHGKRSWTDLPLRAGLVSGVAGAVSASSALLPAQLTGILSVMPTVTTALILVLHGRIGGPATAALLAHSSTGLIGMMLAFVLVNLTVVSWGPVVSLSAALALCIGWNLMLIALRQGFAAWGRRNIRRAPAPRDARVSR